MSILDIRIQKLFAITLVLKVAASLLGWYFQSPWVLGFAVPLVFMCGYIGLGINRRDKEVSDEKFADSVYYLGFIFTITSIIFSLFDLPHIGTRIQDIAVRFGAAMVSTVLGLFIRVYLVSFRTDVADAIRDAEDALLGATQKFTERLTMSLERLQDFESRVDLATQSSIERVNLQIESLSKNHAAKLTEFFADLTNRNQEAFTSALEEVKNASVRLAVAVDRYSVGMKGNLASIETKVGAFAEAVTSRLQNTTFPDDYFARHLQAPMAQLEAAAGDVAKHVNGACQRISKATAALDQSLEAVQSKSGDAEVAMESVLKLAGQQHLILQTAEGHLGALDRLTTALSAFEQLLNNTTAEMAANNTTSSALTVQVEKLATEALVGRQALQGSLAEVAATLGQQAATSTALLSRVDATVTSSERVVAQLGEAAVSQLKVTGHLQATVDAAIQAGAKYAASVEAEQASAHALATLGNRADRSLAKIGEAVQALHDVVRHVGDLAKSVRSHGDAARISTGALGAPQPGGLSTAFSATGTDSRPSLLTQTPNSMLTSAPGGVTPGTASGIPELPTFRMPQPAGAASVPASNIEADASGSKGHLPAPAHSDVTRVPPSAQG